MATFDLLDRDTGTKLTIDANRPPTQEEVEGIFQEYRKGAATRTGGSLEGVAPGQPIVEPTPPPRPSVSEVQEAQRQVEFDEFANGLAAQLHGAAEHMSRPLSTLGEMTPAELEMLKNPAFPQWLRKPTVATQEIIKFANSFTSQAGAMQAAGMAMPGITGRTLLGYMLYQGGQQAKESIKGLEEEYSKPEEQRDPDKLTSLWTKFGIDAAMTVGGAKGLTRGLTPINTLAPRTMEALRQQLGGENASTIRSDTGPISETRLLVEGGEANRGGNLQQETPRPSDATRPQEEKAPIAGESVSQPELIATEAERIPKIQRLRRMVDELRKKYESDQPMRETDYPRMRALEEELNKLEKEQYAAVMAREEMPVILTPEQEAVEKQRLAAELGQEEVKPQPAAERTHEISAAKPIEEGTPRAGEPEVAGRVVEQPSWQSATERTPELDKLANRDWQRAKQELENAQSEQRKLKPTATGFSEEQHRIYAEHQSVIEESRKIIAQAEEYAKKPEPETKPVGKEITPEQIGFDQPFTEPPWRQITDEEAASASVVGDIATKDARIAGSTSPVSHTRRLLVLQSKDPNDPTVHLVSVYKSGRTGAMAVDPIQAGKGKPNRQLSTLLERYKPIYSVLLNEPVQNFHQAFESLPDFYARFGDKAIELASGKTGEAPTQVTEAVAPTEAETTLLPTSSELGQAFRVLKPLAEKFSAEEISQQLATKPSRQLASAVKKVAQHILETNPEIEPKEAIAQAIETLHEHAQRSENAQAFTKSVLQRFTGQAGESVEFDEIGKGGETALENRHGTATGLPPGVPEGGPNFPAELMEASRRLGTLVRSKTNLPSSTLGRYRRATIAQDDAIEVGDIRNQQTVSHEMGHDMDALLFPTVNLADSQKSLRARTGIGTPKELVAELIPVSELMRGDITGSKGHIAYRKRATELVADFVSLYLHDPERARAMAPKFAQGFENKLNANADAAETVRQLHAGNVEPVAPQALQPPTATPAEMPGQVPARPKAAPIERDRALAVASEELVKGQIRRFEAEVQGARIKADRWREQVPDQEQRNDVGAFVEGIGNLEKAGDTIADVQSRMTPDMKQFAKNYRFNIELQRQRINEYLKGTSAGEYLQFLEDYLAHFYANSKTPAGRVAISRFIKESPHAKMRKIPTLREAVEYGLKPISQDPAVLYEATARVNWRVATNRKLLSELKGMKSAGDPIIVPAGKAPPGWPISNNPLIQRVYARQTPSGTMLWKGGAAIHPDAWRAVRQMLETPTSNGLTRAYDAINSLTRANAFAFSLFHDLTLRSASLGAEMKWFNPVRGLFRVFERNPTTGRLEGFRSTREVGKELLMDEKAVTDAALHGLKFSWQDSESYQKVARDVLEKAAAQWKDIPVIGKTAEFARDVQHMRQKGLWRNTHDAFKIMAYNDLVGKALQDAPAGTNPKIVKERIASMLNDAFGGQEWQTKFWMSPEVRSWFARFWLAPDWTVSTLRSVPGVTPKEGVSGAAKRAKFWGAEIAALATATVAAQYAIYHAFGDKEKGDREWVWENETGQQRRIDATPLMRKLPWRDPNDPTRYYINLGKRPEEIIGWVVHPEQNTLSKMARPVAEVFKQITGTQGDFEADWKKDHEAFIESIPSRAKSVAGQLVPFTFSGNQFALSLPYRKGMTKYKAEQAYESAYEIAAEPSAFKSFLRGQSPDTEKVISEITDAAERNGVPADVVRRRALSVVRGKYYADYFKALKNEDEKGLDKAATALVNLGATRRTIQESVKARQKLEPSGP